MTKRKVRRKVVQIEKVSMSNLSLYDLLDKKIVSGFERISKEMKKKINPVAFIFMVESKIDDKIKIEPLTISHLSKKDFLDKKINIEINDEELMNKTIDTLKDI